MLFDIRDFVGFLHFVFTDFGKNDFGSVIFVGVLVGIIPVAAWLGIADKTWKQVKDRQRIIRFESEGVRSFNEHIEVLYKWSGCKKVTETPQYIFAETIQGVPMFVLSKSWLSEDILNTLREWVALKEIKVVKK